MSYFRSLWLLAIRHHFVNILVPNRASEQGDTGAINEDYIFLYVIIFCSRVFVNVERLGENSLKRTALAVKLNLLGLAITDNVFVPFHIHLFPKRLLISSSSSSSSSTSFGFAWPSRHSTSTSRSAATRSNAESTGTRGRWKKVKEQRSVASEY